MTTAVLKNRLLQLTSREFDERAYGATSMTEFPALLPDLLELDLSTRPPQVTLLSGGGQEPPTADSLAAARVRPDLWHAVFDYTDPGVYVWDGGRAIAIPADQAIDDAARLPTLTPAELDTWRIEFGKEHDSLDVAAWGDAAYSTYALPEHLRAQWNFFMKTRALQRLRDWFGSNGIESPKDMLVQSERQVARSTENSEVEELRRYVLRCVAAMRPAELRALQIPATVAARIAR